MSSVFSLGNGLVAHSSGALWIADSQTAVVADVHLGYGWAQRRRGELGPLADFRTREKLTKLCDELQPREIVLLGDLVHAPRPCEPERAWIEETLNELAKRAELTVIRGNHDRAFAREFAHLGLRCAAFWSNEQVTAIHGDRLPDRVPEAGTLVLGHLHPSLAIIDAAGADQKVPLFLSSSGCVVLPAFSPFSRGYDVASGLPDELLPFFRGEDIQAFAATGTRVVSLGPLRRAVERMFKADVSAPAQFRRGHRGAVKK